MNSSWCIHLHVQDERARPGQLHLYFLHVGKSWILRTGHLYLGKADHVRSISWRTRDNTTKKSDLKWEAELWERNQTGIVGKLWERERESGCVCVCVAIRFRSYWDTNVANTVRRISKCVISRVHCASVMASRLVELDLSQQPILTFSLNFICLLE